MEITFSGNQKEFYLKKLFLSKNNLLCFKDFSLYLPYDKNPLFIIPFDSNDRL